ncbi:MAG: anhydro-N-acetylmuramic acid kinase, partial [Methylococcales bacterium]|nr:anhydro-N-acetylmuramic acid kinase [Methylococcales bacterium]
ASLNSSEIRAIGSHGQTICHAPQATPPYTVQLGCGHTISALTKLPVVADFRMGDIVLGGQGAPFAPLYHQVLFQNLEKPLAVLNLGGIANLTYLMPDIRVKGYDVGPANALLDAWTFQHLGKTYDKDGAWAAQGKVIPALLERLLADPFFSKASPKSIGKEYYSLHWLSTFLTAEMLPEDVQATLLSLTITCVQRALEHDKADSKRLLVSGGGVHNIKLMQLLATALPHVNVESTAVCGIDPDFIEAMLFAWLASKNLAREPVDLRMITGSKEKRVLGCFYPTY